VNIRQFLSTSRLVATGILVATILGCQDKVANGGTNDETSTVAFYTPDGKPAVGARVQVFASSDTGVLPRAEVFTDAHGGVALPALPAGYYNLVVRDEAGRAVFQDSLVSDGSKLPYKSDTIVATGAIKGRVLVQPQDDPRIVLVTLLGAGRYANVDDSGRFLIADLPEGRYTLVLRADQPEYTTTVLAASIRRDSVTDLGSVSMVFTGMPIVTGIVGKWDSLDGLVSVSWDSAKSAKISGWSILRSRGDDPSSAVQVAYLPVHSTSWTDSVYNPGVDSAMHLRYWIRSSGKAGQKSVSWNSWAVDVRPPAKIGNFELKWSDALSRLGGISAFDTIGGRLAAVTVVTYPTPVASLNLSSDGIHWTTVWQWRDTTCDYGGTGFCSANSKNIVEGIGKGVFHGGRFHWAEVVASGRSVQLPGETPFDAAGSIFVHSIGPDGVDLSRSAPVSSDSVGSVDLIRQGDTLSMVQSYLVFPSMMGAYITHFQGRLIREANGSWTANSHADEWQDDPALCQRIDVGGVAWFVHVSLNGGRFPNGYSLSRSYAISGDSIQGSVTSMTGYRSNLFFVSPGGLFWAEWNRPGLWHAIPTAKIDHPRMTIQWNGQLWVVDGQEDLWSAALP